MVRFCVVLFSIWGGGLGHHIGFARRVGTTTTLDAGGRQAIHTYLVRVDVLLVEALDLLLVVGHLLRRDRAQVLVVITPLHPHGLQ